MELKEFDGKIVRITDDDGSEFEGICEYNTDEYNEVLYGENEESLMLACWNFYQSTIRNVQIIPEFSGPYGHLEAETIETDAMLVSEFFDREEDAYAWRMLAALEHYLTSEDKAKIPDMNELADALKEASALTEDEAIRGRLQRLLDLCR